MKKTIIAKVKSTDVAKTIIFVAFFIVACILIVPRYVIEEESSSKYFVAIVALAMVIAGIWAIARIIQRTFISGIISIDSKNLYLGKRRIAWKKIEQIITIQKTPETYLVVTTGDVPADKMLIFEEDDDPTEDSESLAYRINLSNFNLPPDKIEQILNEKLKQYKKNSKRD